MSDTMSVLDTLRALAKTEAQRQRLGNERNEKNEETPCNQDRKGVNSFPSFISLSEYTDSHPHQLHSPYNERNEKTPLRTYEGKYLDDCGSPSEGQCLY